MERVYHFGRFTLDERRGSLLDEGREVKLRPKVYEMLKYLVQHSGRLVSKQELTDAVWPETYVTDDSVVQCTIELRRALDDRTHQLLKTVPRRGYVFAAQFGTEAGKQPAAPKLRSADFPVARTPLIGRESEVAGAAELLLQSNVRLLTLTGPGGAGKTRLAVAAAARVAERFSGGMQFVGLASITDADLVGAAVTDALGIQLSSNRPVPQLVAEQMRDSEPFLLVLDNFEQVLAAATTVAELIAACPVLKILVTSRGCLRIYGEQEFPVEPLAQNAAVELFAQRARAVRPTFKVNAENVDAVGAICSRLDGLPLAIELAAARTKVLAPSGILERLQSRLQFLTGGALDMPKRQQTLRATIDWSYELLDGNQQKLFRRFSVFAGGGTVEAAEAVCNTSRDLMLDPFDGLSSLVDKSLIVRDERGAEARFSTFETVREYARERLAQSGEEDFVRRAHAAYCLVLAEEGNPDLDDAVRAAWLERCDLEIDNFRSALDFLFEKRQLDWALRLCMALFRFWDMREHLVEGRSRLETVLRLAGNEYASQRAKVLHFLGAMVTAQGDYGAAQRFLEESLSLYRDLGDEWGVAVALNALAVSSRDGGDYVSAQGNFERSLARLRGLDDRLAVARCLHNLASVLKVRGEYERAREALTEAAEIFGSLGDRSGAAWSLNQQGDVVRERGDATAASALYRRALEAFREIGDRWGTARSLTDLAHVLCERGDYAAAGEAYAEALEIFAELGHKRGIARALEGSASLAAARRQPLRALVLAGATARLRQEIGVPLTEAEQLKLEAELSGAKEALRETQRNGAWREGMDMSLERAIRYAFEDALTTERPDR